SELGEDAGDPALVGGPEPNERCATDFLARSRKVYLDPERPLGDIGDRDLGLDGKIGSNLVLPNIKFEPGLLLGRDVFQLKVAIGPPRHASAVERDGFGEQLIAVVFEGFEIDLARFDRPEPAVAGLIAQVDLLVGGAEEHALPWLVHL